MSCSFYYISWFFSISNCSIYIEYLHNYILLLSLYYHSACLGTYPQRLQWNLMRIIKNSIAFNSSKQIGQPGYWVDEWILDSISHKDSMSSTVETIEILS